MPCFARSSQRRRFSLQRWLSSSRIGSRGMFQHSDDFKEALLNGRGCREREAEFGRQPLQLRTPLRRHDKLRREWMSRAFFENPSGRLSGLVVVDLPERVDQQNVQNITRPSRSGRARARMELLRNLVGKI